MNRKRIFLLFRINFFLKPFWFGSSLCLPGEGFWGNLLSNLYHISSGTNTFTVPRRFITSITVSLRRRESGTRTTGQEKAAAGGGGILSSIPYCHFWAKSNLCSSAWKVDPLLLEALQEFYLTSKFWTPKLVRALGGNSVLDNSITGRDLGLERFWGEWVTQSLFWRKWSRWFM